MARDEVDARPAVTKKWRNHPGRANRNTGKLEACPAETPGFICSFTHIYSGLMSTPNSNESAPCCDNAGSDCDTVADLL